MARLTPEKREAMFAEMRERQQKLREIRPTSAPPAAVPAKPATPAAPDFLAHPEMMRIDEVARTLKMSRQTVVRWFKDRSVIVQGPRRQIMLIPRQVLAEFLEAHYQGR